MRITIINAINKYLHALNNTDWVIDEAYKFEFANYVYQNVKWDSQSNEQILDILKKSQKLKYTGNERGIQFVLKSGREKLSEFISIEDVRLLRRIHTGENPKNIDWKSRSMSFTGLSAWLASLFPNEVYPVPLVGFNATIKYIFDTDNKPFPKQGKKYLFHCQSFMRETEELLKKYPLEDLCLQVWNQYYESNPEFGIKPKNTLSKVDWVWLVQDFHLFVHRKVLGLYKKKEKNISMAEHNEPTAIEGNSKLATHMRYERNSALIRKINQKAIQENKMLNCEVCGFSFLGVYGEIGEGFIEAHHKNPLSSTSEKITTKASDIALVCSNCHRMLHKGDPIYHIKELKKLLQN